MLHTLMHLNTKNKNKKGEEKKRRKNENKKKKKKRKRKEERLAWQLDIVTWDIRFRLMSDRCK